jgi:Tfp pilus assembly protein PilE
MKKIKNGFIRTPIKKIGVAPKEGGFTLIEVIIYIALFSLLLGTAFVVGYQLIEGAGKLNTKTNVTEEGNFVVRKFNWTFSNVSSITTPSSGTSNTLTLTKYDGNVINIKLKENKIEMKESSAGNTFTAITTDNVSVNSLQFTYIPASGNSPEGITATTIINDTTFSITKYLRQ